MDQGSFTAKGLHYEELLTHFYEGNFEAIQFDRDAQLFSLLLNSYITEYAKRCDSSLPSSKIELTKDVCTTERVTTNGYGVEVGRTCVAWKQVGLGIYASPEMHNAKLVIDGLQAGDSFRTMWRMITQEDPLNSAMSQIGELKAVQADMQTLIRMNGCNSKGLKRFEENLRLFALNKQPIRLDGSSTKKPLNSGQQNFSKLVEDLVYAHSKTWAMNRYERGSVSSVQVVARDANSHPTKITARYIYQGFSGRSNGSVTITFLDGLPRCLYFFDFPSTCRTADRRIVASYANGGYQ